MIVPQTSMPIKVFINKILAGSPSLVDTHKRNILSDYNWPLISLDGSDANLNASEGKVVLINFWATWCPPCVAEMPSLQNLYNEYGDRVDFYFVTSEDPEKVTSFMEKKNLDLPIYIQKYEEPKEITTQALPTTYVISKQNEIIIEESGAATWDSKKVKEILNTLLSE